MKRFALILALALVACGGKKDDNKNTGGSNQPAGSSQPAGSGSGSATAMAGSGSGSATAGSADPGPGSGSAAPQTAEVDVPTEVDFEEEASKRITDKTVEAELKAVETDLGSN